MKKQKFLLMLATLLTIFLMTACSSGTETEGTTENGQTNTEEQSEEKTYTFKLTHITPPSHNWHKTAEKFNEELKALSNGRMEVEIFPSGQLGTESDMIQQIEAGTVDFGLITNAYLSTRVPSLNGWFMPFLFETLEEANEARSSASAKQFLEDISNENLVALDFAFAGNRHVLMKDGIIKSPEDLNGKKIRIIGSPAMQDFWVENGASPTPMPLPEVYTSLQTGVIDGIDIDLDALVSLNLFEIAKDLTLTNHMAFPSVAVMSKQVRDSLSDADRQIVDEALKNALEWGIQDQIQREEDNLKLLKEKGVNVVEFPNAESFNAVNQKLYEKYGNEHESIKALIEEFK